MGENQAGTRQRASEAPELAEPSTRSGHHVPASTRIRAGPDEAAGLVERLLGERPAEFIDQACGQAVLVETIPIAAITGPPSADTIDTGPAGSSVPSEPPARANARTVRRRC